jgi:hypothetical protein
MCCGSRTYRCRDRDRGDGAAPAPPGGLSVLAVLYLLSLSCLVFAIC